MEIKYFTFIHYTHVSLIKGNLKPLRTYSLDSNSLAYAGCVKKTLSQLK